MKIVTAVSPYKNKTGNNFKRKPFVAWENCGGKWIKGYYPPIFLRRMIHAKDLIPTLQTDEKEARLCFVQPLTLYYDTFSSVLSHEIIPFIWDCWPCYDEKLCVWIKRHKVKACIFTSSEAANRIGQQIPDLKILIVTEGVNTIEYAKGKELKDRDYDVYLFGRWPGRVSRVDMSPLSIVRNGTDEEFRDRLQNSKITINVPRCDVVPKQTGTQETLTQRYWECMLSRMVMVGRAPKELTNLIGYNPVIDIDYDHFADQVYDIVAHVEDYQPLVDKNREVALQMAPWEIRMKQVMEWLKGLGYDI